MDTIASMTASPQICLWQQHVMELLFTNVLYINKEVSLLISSSHHIKDICFLPPWIDSPYTTQVWLPATSEWQPLHESRLSPYRSRETTIVELYIDKYYAKDTNTFYLINMYFMSAGYGKLKHFIMW